MRRVRRSVLLAFAASDVYRLIADVERYAEFLPWCTSSDILSQTPDEVVGRLGVHVAGRRETLVTRNRMIDGHSIGLELMEGPFRRMEGVWTFTPIGDIGCRVELEISFDLANRLIGAFAASFVDRAADKVLHAFAARARAVLGR